MSESVSDTSENVSQRFGNSPREFSGTKLMLGVFTLAPSTNDPARFLRLRFP